MGLIRTDMSLIASGILIIVRLVFANGAFAMAELAILSCRKAKCFECGGFRPEVADMDSHRLDKRLNQALTAASRSTKS